MRVIHLAPIRTRYKPPTVSFIWDLVVAQREQGVDAQLLLLKSVLQSKWRLPKLPPWCHVVSYWPKRDRSTLGKLHAVTRWATKQQSGFLLHGHFLHEEGWVAAHAVNGSIPSVVSAHGTDVHTILQAKPMMWSSIRALQALEKATVPTCVDASLFTMIQSIRKLDVAILPVGGWNSAIHKNSVHTTKNQQIILFIGRATKAKGFHVLLQACNRLFQNKSLVNNDVILQCIGVDAIPDEFKQLISSHNRLHIQCLGYLEHAQVLSHIQQCTCLCLPSLAEGLPVSVIEGLAAGKPVVATNVGGLHSLVSSQNGCLIEPGNTEALYQGLRHVLKQQNWQSDEISTSVEHLRYDVLAKKWKSFYQQII